MKTFVKTITRTCIYEVSLNFDNSTLSSLNGFLSEKCADEFIPLTMEDVENIFSNPQNSRGTEIHSWRLYDGTERIHSLLYIIKVFISDEMSYEDEEMVDAYTDEETITMES